MECRGEGVAIFGDEPKRVCMTKRGMPDEWERDGDNFDKTMYRLDGGVKVSMKGVDQERGRDCEIQ